MAYDPATRAGGWVTARSRRYIVVAAGGSFAVGAVLLALLAARPAHHILLIASGAALLVLVGLLRPMGELAERYRKGSVAEQAVGDALDGLRRDGFFMLHDVDDPQGGNIDHIVSGPTGVYLIETKFSYFRDRDLGKVMQQACRLHDELGVWVTPVICLGRRDRKPWLQKKVAVVPLQHLIDWIKQQSNQTLDFERFARFADGL